MQIAKGTEWRDGHRVAVPAGAVIRAAAIGKGQASIKVKVSRGVVPGNTRKSVRHELVTSIAAVAVV